MDILSFYKTAKAHIVEAGFEYEIDAVNNRQFETQTSADFFRQYVYVVLNSGMRNQVAEEVYTRFWQKFSNTNSKLAGRFENVPLELGNIRSGVHEIGHPGKQRAIFDAYNRYRQWFAALKQQKSLEKQLSFLESLPWIGPITKYHLARNLGIDVAKPDRHLVHIVKAFGFDDVQRMCSFVSKRTGDRIGVVDVVFWRAMNLSNGNLLKEFEWKVLLKEMEVE